MARIKTRADRVVSPFVILFFTSAPYSLQHRFAFDYGIECYVIFEIEYFNVNNNERAIPLQENPIQNRSFLLVITSRTIQYIYLIILLNAS